MIRGVVKANDWSVVFLQCMNELLDPLLEDG